MQLLAALLLILALPTAAVADHLLLVTDYDFPPYSYAVDGRMTGIDIEIIQKAARRAGLSIGIEQYPWKRVLRMIESGEADGGFSLFHTQEREQYAIYSHNPLRVSVLQAFASRDSSIRASTVEDLHGQTVLIPAGFAISEKFDAAVREERIVTVWVNNAADGIKRLMRSKDAILVGNRDAIQFHARQLGVAEMIRPLFILVGQRSAFLVLSRKRAGEPHARQDFEKLDRELGRMRLDGSMARIIRNYVK